MGLARAGVLERARCRSATAFGAESPGALGCWAASDRAA